MKASVRLEHQLVAVEDSRDINCMLELLAPPAPSQTERRPLAVALVIDRSGSMAGRKLEVTKACASFLVDRLAADGQLAIVTYDDQVQLRAVLAAVGPNRGSLHQVIAGISPGGQTNLSGGWLKGIETLSAVDETTTRRVLLLTDGQANIGITDATQLAVMAGASAGDGIGTTTIGFGDGFDEDLLSGLADAGRGGAHFAETPDDAPGIFAQEFADLVTLVGQNVSVEIRPAWEDVAVLHVLNQFPQVPVAGGVQIQLGDAYGDERRRVVFSLHVPTLGEMGVKTVAEVIVRYVSVGATIEAHTLTLPITVNLVSADEAAAQTADAEVTEEVVVLLSARAQEEARTLADRGDFEGAKERLSSAAAELRKTAEGSARADELLARAETFTARSIDLDPMTYMIERKKMTYENRLLRERKRRPE